jgi:uncharacterized metal-binding protein YceD (DUF177 family)
MKQPLNEFLIPFIGLKLGKHQFEYQIDNNFFDKFEFDEYENSNINVIAVLDKKSVFMELELKHNGTVNVACDTTGEYFDLEINSKIRVVIQFGEEFNNDNEELLIIPHGEHQIDISQYIYEMIVLSVPLRRVHPGIKDGSLQSESLNKLKELEVKTITEEENIDPRWDKLKQLLTDK